MPPNPAPRLSVAVLAALVLGACATTAPPRPQPPVARVVRPAAPAACTTCGRIERIDAAATVAGARPTGAVLGGVVGGVLARPAPAAAGSTARPAGPAQFRLVVLLDNGRRLILTQALQPGMKVGARVRVDRSRAVLLR